MKRRIQNVSLILAIAAFALAGCKKHVAANTPTPAPAPAPQRAAAPTITLRATPGALDRGQAATLQWDAKNATNVQIQPAVGTVTSTGSRSVNPTSSVTYTATATGPGGSASDSARITVRVPAAPAARATPRAAPNVNMADLFRQNVEMVHFDYDKADIRPDQIARLQNDAAWLKQHPGVKFTVEGHCDDRGSEEYNLGLGDRRANAVKEYLVKQGVPQTVITTISYGEERPLCRDDNEQCFQQNRRAAFSPAS
ncbi:MAG TPA: peptidoglycan-associated lipoprotein Pal [Terriglobia bacterium]